MLSPSAGGSSPAFGLRTLWAVPGAAAPDAATVTKMEA